MHSGQENFRNAIEFHGPAYLPCILGKGWVELAWLNEQDTAKQHRIEELCAQFSDDLLAMNAARKREEPVKYNDFWYWVDEWGTGWADH